MTRESVRQILIEAARLKTPLRYSEVLDMHNLERNPATLRQLMRILIKIGKEEYSSGRPLLNGLVVGKKSGRPGDGFFDGLQEMTGRIIPLENPTYLKNLMNEIFEDCYSYYSLAVRNLA